jgi:hypothetical protein
MTADQFLDRLHARFPHFWDRRPTVGRPDYMLSVDTGWYPLIEEALERYDAVLQRHGVQDRYRVRQIKEKMGQLRLYIRPVPSFHPPAEIYGAMNAIHDEIEERSMQTCERCGMPGEWTSDEGWYVTLCDQHLAERKAAREHRDD